MLHMFSACAAMQIAGAQEHLDILCFFLLMFFQLHPDKFLDFVFHLIKIKEVQKGWAGRREKNREINT